MGKLRRVWLFLANLLSGVDLWTVNAKYMPVTKMYVSYFPEFRADLTRNASKARIRQRIHTFIWLLWQTAVYLTSLAQKTIDAEIADKSWPRFLLFKADINHVFLCETITATPALRLWFLTSKWRTMPKGIWIGRCFLTLITPALHDHVKHKHIPHPCRTTWAESYDIGQESLDARLGPARRRLHLRVTS